MENNLVLLMDHNYAHRLSDTSMDKNLLLNANHVTTGPQQVTEGLVTKCRKKELSRNHNSVEGHVKKKKVKRKCRNKSKEKTPTFRPDGEVDWRPLDDVILAYMSEQGVPGSSLVISYKGNVIHRKGYGEAGGGCGVTPGSMFRIASISKPITAIGILTLYQEGHLQLEQLVFGPKGILKEYSPTVSGDRRLLRVTVRHLLEHSGGWDMEVAGDPMFYTHVGAAMGEQEPVTKHTLICYMMTKKLQFSPGTKHSYSNFGYLVLGRVVERISRQSYESFIQEILHPLGVSSLRLGATKRSQAHPDEVEYFAPIGGDQVVESIYPGEGRVRATYGGFCMENMDANGGWTATADDLTCIFDHLNGYAEPRILKPETLELMLQRPSFNKGADWYGLGLDVEGDRKSWFHSGALDGTSGILTHHASGLTWAFLCNYSVEDTDFNNMITYAINKVMPFDGYFANLVEGAVVAGKDESLLVLCAVSASSVKENINKLALRGYRPTWISGYQVTKQTFFNVIWIKDDTQWHCEVLVDKWVLSQKEDELRQLSYDLVFIDSCLHNDELCFSSIFLKQPPSVNVRKLHVAAPLKEHYQRLEKHISEGVIPVVSSVIHHKGEALVTSLYDHGHPESIWANCDLTVCEYQTEFHKHARHGHLLSYIKAYEVNDEVKFSAIWTNPGPYKYISTYDNSKYRLYNELVLHAHQNFEVRCISGYDVEGIHNFVAVWNKYIPK